MSRYYSGPSLEYFSHMLRILLLSRVQSLHSGLASRETQKFYCIGFRV